MDYCNKMGVINKNAAGKLLDYLLFETFFSKNSK